MKDSQYFQFRGTCNNEVTDYLALNWGGGKAQLIRSVRSRNVTHVDIFNIDNSIESDAQRLNKIRITPELLHLMRITTGTQAKETNMIT